MAKILIVDDDIVLARLYKKCLLQSRTCSGTPKYG